MDSRAPAQEAPREVVDFGPWFALAAGWAWLGTAACATIFVISTIPAPPPWGRSIPTLLQLASALLAIAMIPICAGIPVPLLIAGRRRLRSAAAVPTRWTGAWTAAASAGIAVEATFLYRLVHLFLTLGSFWNLPQPSWHALAFTIAYAAAGIAMGSVMIAAKKSATAASRAGATPAIR